LRGTFNSVLSLFIRQSESFRDAVIVKNGPEDGDWSPSIDIASLRKTLWWSNVSGLIQDTVAQRDLERIITTNF
jgi:hypothetical protein